MHMWSLTAHLPAYYIHWMVLFRRNYICLGFVEQIILTVPLCSVSDIVANAHVVAFMLIILTRLVLCRIIHIALYFGE